MFIKPNYSRPGLGLESWPGLAPLSTLSHALPGFLSHPQVVYDGFYDNFGGHDHDHDN